MDQQQQLALTYCTVVKFRGYGARVGSLARPAAQGGRAAAPLLGRARRRRAALGGRASLAVRRRRRGAAEEVVGEVVVLPPELAAAARPAAARRADERVVPPAMSCHIISAFILGSICLWEFKYAKSGRRDTPSPLKEPPVPPRSLAFQCISYSELAIPFCLPP